MRIIDWSSDVCSSDLIGAEASTNKIFWSELDLLMHETALRILGPLGELMPEAPDAGDAAPWLDGFLFAPAGPIYAGPNETQRSEARRVGKEGVSTFRSRGSPYS